MEYRIPIEVKMRCIELIQQDHPISEIAELFDVSRKTVHKWFNRYRTDGMSGLKDCSTRPYRSPSRLPDNTLSNILDLRKRKRLGPMRIALRLGLSQSSVYRTLCRYDQQYLHPKRPRMIMRYEKNFPGELWHLDTTLLVPLRRGQPKEHPFAVLDDFSREVFSRIYPTASTKAATDFLLAALKYYAYDVKAVLTDNAFCFTMRYATHCDRTTLFAKTCSQLGIRHQLLRPYHPESNGKVERFFRTVNEECYNCIRLKNSSHRRQVLQSFIYYYNHQRPHLGLGGLTPIQRRKMYFETVTDVLK